MSTKKRKNLQSQSWIAISNTFLKEIPHIRAYLEGIEDFRELRIKVQHDGTMLGILKAWSSDGTPIVCFGSGYDTAACLVALNATVNGGNWRDDPPWKPGKG